MDVKQEIVDIIQKVWTKLQALPQAKPLEIGTFAVVVLFMATVVFMLILACINCCCCGKPKHQGTRVQPLHSC